MEENRMNYYVLNNNEKIYPLLRIEYEGNNYLLYSNKEINLTKDDIYVGEEKNEQLLPVKNCSILFSRCPAQKESNELIWHICILNNTLPRSTRIS